MRHETSDTPMETARTETPTRTETTTTFGPTSAFENVRTRLGALKHLRPSQFAVLALLAVFVAFVALAPPALSAFLGLFVATVALLVVVPYVVVRGVTDGR